MADFFHVRVKLLVMWVDKESWKTCNSIAPAQLTRDSIQELLGILARSRAMVSDGEMQAGKRLEMLQQHSENRKDVVKTEKLPTEELHIAIARACKAPLNTSASSAY